MVFLLTGRQISCRLGHPEIVEMSQKRLEKCQGEACSIGRSKGFQSDERHPEFRRAKLTQKAFFEGLGKGLQPRILAFESPFLVRQSLGNERGMVRKTQSTTP